MRNIMDLTAFQKHDVYPLSDNFAGAGPQGELSFTNAYMQLNGEPFFAISGECHFSRVSECMWEDSILKMKMGGINVVSTYVFWIHHEEEEGVFRFDGNRNLRKFIQICRKHEMYAIVRIGPFDHGEVRNGGLPDWLYGKPFEVRSTNQLFLDYTRRLYRTLSQQLSGLLFKDGGPVIAVQLDNEYMHSAAPWEMTTGVSNEWVPAGDEGNAYMLQLKRIAVEEGLETPFYTCTGWGGAATPMDEMLPLWGGYAYWPWIFYDYDGPHPATPEYIYRYYHNDSKPHTYNFEPSYTPESLPYACCEMGGGMSCFYNYRFQLPFESIDAMANIKLAGGCSFLGYYMYRGGSNPKGTTTQYLNECQCPKISYDYQAVIGEFGQLRPSYHRLRVLHTLVRSLQEKLCEMETVLPEGAEEIDPQDSLPLRFAVRTDGSSGFVFINNFQDHAENQKKENETISLLLHDETITYQKLSLAAGEETILPFNMDIGGHRLICAKAQPLSAIQTEQELTWFFFMPEGMNPEFVFDGRSISRYNGQPVHEQTLVIEPEAEKATSFILDGTAGRVRVVLLTRAQSLMFYETNLGGIKRAVLCDAPMLCDGTQLRIESTGNRESICLAYPPITLQTSSRYCTLEETAMDVWKGYRLNWNETEENPLAFEQVGPYRYTLQVPNAALDSKEVLLRLIYRGDIGSAFINGELVADNFYNGAVWEIGIREKLEALSTQPMTVLITPLKENSKVNVSSTMAGRSEENEGQTGVLEAVRIRPVYEAVLL